MPRYLLAAAPLVLSAACLVGCSTSQRYASKGDPRKPTEHSRVAAHRGLKGRLANASYSKPSLNRLAARNSAEPNVATRAKPALPAEVAEGSELALMYQLHDRSPAARALAAFDLSRLESPSPKATKAIAHRLEVERDPRVRTFLNEGLVRLAPDRRADGLSEIQQAAHSQDEGVRALAAVVLADLEAAPR